MSLLKLAAKLPKQVITSFGELAKKFDAGTLFARKPARIPGKPPYAAKPAPSVEQLKTTTYQPTAFGPGSAPGYGANPSAASRVPVVGARAAPATAPAASSAPRAPFREQLRDTFTKPKLQAAGKVLGAGAGALGVAEGLRRIGGPAAPASPVTPAANASPFVAGTAAAQGSAGLAPPAGGAADAGQGTSGLLSAITDPETWKAVGNHASTYWPAYALGGTGLLAANALLSRDDEEEDPYGVKYGADKLAAGIVPPVAGKPSWVPGSAQGGANWASKALTGPGQAPAKPPVQLPTPGATQESAQRMANKSMLQRGVVPAPDPRDIAGYATPAPNKFMGGLNLLHNVTGRGLIGAGQYALNRGAQAVAAPVAGISSMINGKNSPTTVGWSTFNEQLGQNARAGATDMSNAFSTQNVPSATFGHARQQTAMAEGLPKPDGHVAGLMQATPSLMGKGLQGAGRTLGMLPGGKDPDSWAVSMQDYGKQLRNADPSAMEPIADIGSAMVSPGSLAAAGGKALGAAGKVSRVPALARTGTAIAKAAPYANAAAPLTVASELGGGLTKAMRLGRPTGRVGTALGISAADAISEPAPTELSPQQEVAINRMTNRPPTPPPSAAPSANVAMAGAGNAAVTGGGAVAAPKPGAAATPPSPAAAAGAAAVAGGGAPAAPAPGTAMEQADTASQTNLDNMTPEAFAQFKTDTAKLKESFAKMSPEQQKQVAPQLARRHVSQYMKETGIDQKELTEKVMKNMWSPQDLPKAAQQLQEEAAKNSWKMPTMQDAYSFMTSETVPWWQKAAVVLGIGLSTMGLMRMISGGDGALMGLLGLGGLAVGSGMFNEQLTGAADSLMGGFNSLMGGEQQPSAQPGAGAGAGAQATAGGAAPGTMTAQPKQMPAGLTGAVSQLLQDGSLSPQDMQQLRSPEMVQQFASVPDAQIPGVVEQLRQDPAFAEKLNSQLSQYNTAQRLPRWITGDTNAAAIKAVADQTGLPPEDAARYWNYMKTIPVTAGK